MSKFQDIDISIEPASSASQLPAILSELQFRLTQLIENGTRDSIDLRTLPLFPGDYERLRECLGEGEVHVLVDTLGPSEIYETRFPGIWWIRHFNQHDENVAEYIEITSLPALLESSPQDIQRGAQQLQQLIDNDDHSLNDHRGVRDETG